MPYLMATLVLGAKTFDHWLGYELGKRFGLLPALGIILVLYGIPYLIIKAMGGRPDHSQGEAMARRQDEADQRRASADGPPRFNG